MRIIITAYFIGMMINGLAQSSAHYGAAKFAPEDGKKLLILGQDLGAVGGLDSYADGYVDSFGHVPAGVTTYTSIPGLSGLHHKTNWGAGDVHGQAYINEPTFDNSCVAIGLYLVNQLFGLRQGYYDSDLQRLGEWIQNAHRPVFLRIGYEFDGPWNNYDPEDFIMAWKYLVHYFDEMGVTNVAYVWQSAGINTANMDRWYPGDTYVNWVGYSHFDGPNPGNSMRNFASDHQKPIMIAEATPRRDLAQGSGQAHWDAWFAPLFEEIYASDAIKAFAYINTDWDSQSMWEGQGWGDSRVQVSQLLHSNWQSEIAKDTWLLADGDLFAELQFDHWSSPVVLSANDKIDESAMTFIANEHELTLSANGSYQFDHVIVSDLQGRKLFESDTSKPTYHIMLTRFDGQLLIVRARIDGRTVTHKILLNQKHL